MSTVNSLDTNFTITHDNEGIGLFAKPLATDKIEKKIIKLLKFMKSDPKKHYISGIKTVTKAIIKQKQQGIGILMGDLKQIDMIAHIPIIFENNNIPYIWIGKRKNICNELTGLRTKAISSVMLIIKDNLDDKHKQKFDELYKKIIKITPEF